MKFIKENEKSIMVVVGIAFIFCIGYVSGGVMLASNLYKDLVQKEIHKGMTQVRESSENHTVPAKTYASGAFDMVFWEKAHKAKLLDNLKVLGSSHHPFKQIDKMRSAEKDWLRRYAITQDLNIRVPEYTCGSG